MSNDEEKEEEEVRREHARLTWVGRDCVVFFYAFAFRMHPSRDSGLFGARDRRVLERGGGAAFARISRIFLILGWFFPVSDDDANLAMCSDIVAVFVSRFSQQQEEGHSEEEEEEEEHEDGALVRFASKASVRKRTTFSDDHVLIEFAKDNKNGFSLVSFLYLLVVASKSTIARSRLFFSRSRRVPSRERKRRREKRCPS